MDKQDIIRLLSTLLETSKDGEYGFRLSAMYAKSTSVKLLFLTRAKDCALAASELQHMKLVHGDTAIGDISTADTLCRGWVSFSGSLAGCSDLYMLEEAQRGEEIALKHYREVLLDDALPPDVRSVVEIQFEGARRSQNQIRDLCTLAFEMSN